MPNAPMNSKEAIELYRSMMRIRRFEEAAGDLMAKNRIPGFLHLSIGQEAVAVGVCSYLTARDMMTSTHRGHGHCIAKGGRVDLMMAEIFGKPEGYCRGRSGSMHVADPSVGILGANGIVAGGIPIAVGAALSAQLRQDGTIAVAFFGDGAAAEGIFHESLNLASLWQLPVVFVCENNQYAELSHITTHMRARSVTEFATPYHIASGSYDGNDVVAVRDAAALAIEKAREGGGPSLLEFQTYRWRGHFEGDQQLYRSSKEVEEWKLRDPLLKIRGDLTTEYGFTPEVVSAVDEAVEREISDGVAWASALTDPDESILEQDVYFEVTRSSLGART